MLISIKPEINTWGKRFFWDPSGDLVKYLKSEKPTITSHYNNYGTITLEIGGGVEAGQR